MCSGGFPDDSVGDSFPMSAESWTWTREVVLQTARKQGDAMRLVNIAGEREVQGRNAAMKQIQAKSTNDPRIGHTMTAPKLALQLSEPGAHYSTEIFLLKREG